MLAKFVMNSALSRLQHGAVKVTYWDGSTLEYGTGAPYFTLKLNHPRAVRAMMRNQSLGFGESYMKGDIDIDGPLDNVGRLASENSGIGKQLKFGWSGYRPKANTKSVQKSYIHHHYDLGNDFYKLWLDRSMAYSCAYFKTPDDSLEDAQAQKIDHILRKLQLQKNHHLLDIGCGWGTLLFQAAEKYGVSGLGITLSEEQYRHCTEEAKRRHLDTQLTFRLLNYQDLAKEEMRFDRIVSVGMFEHVGRRNQAEYFKAIDHLLKTDGLSVLHTISADRDVSNDPWIDRYIFPGGHLPTVQLVTDSLDHHDFRLTDYESLKIHYALTLDEWWRRFEIHKEKIISMYDERFYRMWRLWLASSSAGFRYGTLDVSQFVFTKNTSTAQLPLTREHMYLPIRNSSK